MGTLKYLPFADRGQFYKTVDTLRPTKKHVLNNKNDLIYKIFPFKTLVFVGYGYVAMYPIACFRF